MSASPLSHPRGLESPSGGLRLFTARGRACRARVKPGSGTQGGWVPEPGRGRSRRRGGLRRDLALWCGGGAWGRPVCAVHGECGSWGLAATGPGRVFPAGPGVEARGPRHVCAVFRHRRARPLGTVSPQDTTRLGAPCAARWAGRAARRAAPPQRSGSGRTRRPPRCGTRRAQAPHTRHPPAPVTPPRRSRCRGPASSVRGGRASRSGGCVRGSGRAPCRPRSGCAHGRRRCRTAS